MTQRIARDQPLREIDLTYARTLCKACFENLAQARHEAPGYDKKVINQPESEAANKSSGGRNP